jgi:hypothetical protein
MGEPLSGRPSLLYGNLQGIWSNREYDPVSDPFIEVLGWETAEIDLITDPDPKTSNSNDPADAIIEPPATPVSLPGDLWLLGGHRLLCASSLEAASWDRLMDGRVGAMVFTEAPYNVPVSGHVCGLGKVQHAEFAMASGEMSKAEFTTFLGQAIKQLTANVRDGAVLDLCMDWRHLPELMSALKPMIFAATSFSGPTEKLMLCSAHA